MVNCYNDYDFNGSLFYYKGHCVNIHNNYVLDDILVKYFIYNDVKIYIDPEPLLIKINNVAGTDVRIKKYTGLFYDNIDDYLAYRLSGYTNGFEIKTSTHNNNNSVQRPEDN